MNCPVGFVSCFCKFPQLALTVWYKEAGLVREWSSDNLTLLFILPLSKSKKLEKYKSVISSLAGEHVGLEDAVLVVAPLLEPDVLVLQHPRDHRLVGALEPDLAERPHPRLQPVDHPQDAYGGAQPVVLPPVQVGPVEVEGAVGGLRLLQG